MLTNFLENEGNYLNRLHSALTQKTTVLKLYVYYFIPTELICFMYYMG